MMPHSEPFNCVTRRESRGVDSVGRSVVSSDRARVLLVALIAALVTVTSHAQTERTNPLSEESVVLPTLGQMIGTIRRAIRAQTNENFGRSIYAVGDVDGNALNDWIVAHDRCDTLSAYPDGRGSTYPRELLLYRGRHGGLPPVESAFRIGPTEIGADTRYIASGDVDADGHPDLVASIRVYSDTSEGNPGNLATSNLVVFWGNAGGNYSVGDTSRLACEAGIWGGILHGTVADFDSDGALDLLIQNSDGLTNGEPVSMPRLRLFKGVRGARWGRNIPRTATWTMWNWSIRNQSRFEVLDQDCDGAPDLVFYFDSSPFPSQLSVIYGRPSDWPDSLSTESVVPTAVNGRSSLFSDVTGDGTPDLLMNCGGEATVRIYAGRPGQRLTELYGNGYSEAPGGVQWWPKPWAEVWTPDHLDEDWTWSGFSPCRKLGDASFDGRDEIWLFSYPYIVAYLTGPTMDSLVDAWVEIPGTELASAARLGDIDGSGRTTFAFGYDAVPYDITDPFPGGILYVSVRPGLIREADYRERRPMPHVDGEQCLMASSTPVPQSSAVFGRAPRVHSTYDRATGTVSVSWAGAALADARTVALYSLTGDLLQRLPITSGSSTAMFTIGRSGPTVLLCVVEATSVRSATFVLAH